MSALQSLRAASSLEDLAGLLGYRPSALSYILYRIPADQKYAVFTIQKKSGGQREIKAPTPRLKALQRRLATLLYACRDEIEQDRKSRPVSHGFRKGHSIITNARPHRRRRYVLNLDLENFFPTFNFGRVRGYFLKDESFKLQEKVATLVAQIACDGEALPQGSPCSPIISDLLGQILDMRLVRLAKKHRVTYSRYADDITFSTNQREFPAALATPDPLGGPEWLLGTELQSRIEGADFVVNAGKTRMHCRGSRQLVTGLTVNEKVNIRADYYRKARAMCRSVFSTGQFHSRMLPVAEGETDPKPDLTSNLNPLEGTLSHIYLVKKTADQRSEAEQRSKPSATRTLYRKLLFYKYFIRPEQPLILGEGKTDGLYLREAIKRLGQFQPALGAWDGGVFKAAVRFFNYTNQAHEILGLGGGSGDLKAPILDYLRLLKKIQHRPMQHPVIILVDNDKGLESVAATIKKNFAVEITLHTTKAYYHIAHNLYLVKVPEAMPDLTCIESLFPSSVLETELDGKKFNMDKAHAEGGEYGKAEFADRVVRAKADKIDFSGFVPLLDRIQAVISTYTPKV